MLSQKKNKKTHNGLADVQLVGGEWNHESTTLLVQDQACHTDTLFYQVEECPLPQRFLLPNSFWVAKRQFIWRIVGIWWDSTLSFFQRVDPNVLRGQTSTRIHNEKSSKHLLSHNLSTYHCLHCLIILDTPPEFRKELNLEPQRHMYNISKRLHYILGRHTIKNWVGPIESRYKITVVGKLGDETLEWFDIR